MKFQILACVAIGAFAVALGGCAVEQEIENTNVESTKQAVDFDLPVEEEASRPYCGKCTDVIKACQSRGECYDLDPPTGPGFWGAGFISCGTSTACFCN